MFNKEQAVITFLGISLLIPFILQCKTSNKRRAREIGIPFDGITGKHNSITDIPGVKVGYKTLIKGSGKLIVGKGPVRTGVTIVLPKGRSLKEYNIGYFIFNGNGESTGLPMIEDLGTATGPIGLTNTCSVGLVRDAIGEWCFKNFPPSNNHHSFNFGLPVVAETFDGNLNDINGLHIKKTDVYEAITNATGGAIEEGNVGGGTGMICYWFKGGTGTSSRVVDIRGIKYTVGILVQTNFGWRNDLMIRGVPVGKELAQKLLPKEKRDGSVIVIIGTDAPLLPYQLRSLAKRATLGIARTGTIGSQGSGDIFFAFSTQTPKVDKKTGIKNYSSIGSSINKIYRAAVESTEEAVINSLIAAKNMEGKNGFKVYSLPHKRLEKILKKYNRINTHI